MTPYFRLTKLGRALAAQGKRVKEEAPYVVWYVRYRDVKGRTVRRATKARTEMEALKAQQDRMLEEEALRQGKGARAVRHATWEEMLEGYLHSKPDLRAAAPFMSLCKVWLTPFFKGQVVATVTPAECERLLHKANRDGLADSSVEQLFVRARAIFEHGLVRQRVLLENPWAFVDRPKVRKKETVWLQPEQVQALLEKAGEHQLLLLTAVLTGLRRGELAGLRWDDVDFTHGALGAIHVRRSFEGQTKSRRTRVVPLHPVLRDALQAAHARARGELVFPSPRTGKVYDASWHAADLLRSIALRAAVQLPAGCTFHSLRKTFGTHVSRAAGDITATQRLLGQSSPVLTEASYFGPDVGHLEGAVLKLPAYSPTHKDNTGGQPEEG